MTPSPSASSPSEFPERCLSVVMPVYNEAATVERVTQTVLAQPMVAELIAIDDGSTDDTWKILQRLQEKETRLVCHRHETNKGKGAALRMGFSLCQARIVLVQDADLEYNPAEYDRLLRPILDGRAAVVFGSRFIGSEEHRVLYFWHAVANRFLTLLSNLTTNLNLTDMETGFKAFRRDVMAGITLQEDRFGFEPEVTAKVARLKVPIYEVAISYSGRTYAEGKKVNWRDGLRTLFCIVKYGFGLS